MKGITIDPALMNALATALVGMITVLVTFATQYVRTKTQESRNSAYSDAVDIVEDVSANVVSCLMQTVVDGIKEKSADGKLTEDEKTEIKQMAVTAVREQLSENVIQTIGVDKLDIMISTMIESAVRTIKQ